MGPVLSSERLSVALDAAASRTTFPPMPGGRLVPQCHATRGDARCTRNLAHLGQHFEPDAGQWGDESTDSCRKVLADWVAGLTPEEAAIAAAALIIGAGRPELVVPLREALLERQGFRRRRLKQAPKGWDL